MSDDVLHVSLHIPKAGGTTLTRVLEQKFPGRLQLAYGDSDPRVPEPACIHGHQVFDYLTSLIADAGQARWFTMIRDPLKSAVSNYFHLKRASSRSANKIAFEDRGLAEFLTHEKPNVRPNPPGYRHNRYADVFARKPIQEFDFIGITERFDESMFLLYDRMQWNPIYYSPKNAGGYQFPDLPDELVQRFKELNARDYTIYSHAWALLDEHKVQYGSSFDRDFFRFKEALMQKGRGAPQEIGAANCAPANLKQRKTEGPRIPRLAKQIARKIGAAIKIKR